MASSSTPISNPLTGMSISEKLSKANHDLWKMQVLAVIKGAGLEGYLTGESAAPVSTTRAQTLMARTKILPTRHSKHGRLLTSKCWASYYHL
jgi:hypothetical protein